MELTADHLQLGLGAWAAAQDGGGVVLDDPGLYPAAHELAEQGWLKRPFVTDDAALSWWWSQRADLALALSALTGRRRPRELRWLPGGTA
jgi:hypothetical protein